MLRLMTTLMGPIFAKEMVEIARRKRYYFNRALYGGILLFALFTIWDSYRWSMNYQNSQSTRWMARMAEDLFLAVSWVQFGAVFLFVPVFLCGVIAAEREEHTLELLFTTRLTDREIVLGKLLSRVAALVILILCALPVLSLIMLFGGVDPQALGRGVAATLLATLYAGAHSIYFSAVTKSPLGALVRTYWWMILWLAGMPAAMVLVVEAVYRRRMIGTIGQYCLGSLPFLNPIGAFVSGIVGNVYNQMAALVGEWFFPLTFVLPASWSLFLIWRAIQGLRREPVPSRLARILRSALDQLRPGRIGKAGARRRRLKAERTWFGLSVRNPFWLRSRLTRVYDREGHIGRIQWAAWLVAIFFIGVVAVSHPRSLGEEKASLPFQVFTWIGVAVLVAAISGTTLVGDRRRGFLDLVLTTPLTGREILDGTLLGVWQHVQRIYWLPWFLGLFFFLTGATPLKWFLPSVLTATLFGAVLLVHGTVCALVARTMTPALVLTFLFLVLVVIGPLPLYGIFRGGAALAILVLAVGGRVLTTLLVRRRTTPVVVACHFMATHFVLVTLATCWAWPFFAPKEAFAAFHPGYWIITLLERRPWDALRSKGEWGVVLACYLAALGVNLLWARSWTIRNFDRLVGRAGRRPKGEQTKAVVG